MVAIIAKDMLEGIGVSAAEKVDLSKPSGWVLLTEAVNWSAKVNHELFYKLKPALIISSYKNGAVLGVEGGEYDEDSDWEEWDIYYLMDKEVGVASFHDPGGGVYALAEKLNCKIPYWEHGWSGVSRQEEAFGLLSAKYSGDKEQGLYLKRMKYATLPGENSREKSRQWNSVRKKN